MRKEEREREMDGKQQPECQRAYQCNDCFFCLLLLVFNTPFNVWSESVKDFQKKKSDVYCSLSVLCVTDNRLWF